MKTVSNRLLSLAVLALAACGGPLPSDNQPPGGGTQKIQTAGQLSTVLGPVGPIGDAGTDAVPPPGLNVSDVESYTCTTQNWGESEVRSLADRIALDQGIDTIYPGALLRGQSLQDGSFTPITIARSGGTLTLSGLTLAPNSQYSATLDEITPAKVQQAIQDLITTNAIQGTAAQASYELDQTYSSDEMMFKLGLDGRYGGGSVSANFSIDTTSEQNYIFLRFTQKYFDISFQDPVLATDVFKDGAAYQDPEGQIGANNPPLYVSKVTFGRQVFFIAQSSFSAKQVEAALNAAYDGAAASIDVTSGYSQKDILQQTHIIYIPQGGAADLALAPIAAANGTSGMYDAIKNFIADKASANFSASSPGVPVAYTLKYLANREVAQMAYSVAFDKRDCNLVTGSHFSVHIGLLDDQLYITKQVSDGSWPSQWVHTGYSADFDWDVDLNQYFGPGEDTITLSFDLYNNSCGPTGVDLDWFSNGNRVLVHHFEPSGNRDCGALTARYQMTLQRSNGQLTQTYAGEW